MVSGPITDMRFTLRSDEGARVTVSGEDDLSRSRTSWTKRVPFNRLSELIDRRSRRSTRPTTRSADRRRRRSTTRSSLDDGRPGAERGAPGRPELPRVHPEARRPARLRGLPRVRRPAATPTPPWSSTSSRAAAARASPTPATSTSCERDKNLLAFTPTIKVVGPVLRGARCADGTAIRRTPTEVTGKATTDVAEGRAPYPTARGQALSTGPIGPRALLPRTGRTRGNPPNISQPRPEPGRLDGARHAAQEGARAASTVERRPSACRGSGPATTSRSAGMRPPFDGFYYVTQTVHTLRRRRAANPVHRLAARAWRCRPTAQAGGNERHGDRQRFPDPRLRPRRRSRPASSRVLGVVTARVVRIEDDGTYRLDYLGMNGQDDDDVGAGPGDDADGRRPAAASTSSPSRATRWWSASRTATPTSPIILGAVWNRDDQPPDQAQQSADNDVRTIVSRSGHELTFDDTPGAEKVTLKSQGGHEIDARRRARARARSPSRHAGGRERRARRRAARAASTIQTADAAASTISDAGGADQHRGDGRDQRCRRRTSS